ncbi:MAG: ABC transporter substrate-binding protein [Clostridia bacterium]|nr:ABC transporter substrate-binding protein [Clostridia bacterium]
MKKLLVLLAVLAAAGLIVFFISAGRQAEPAADGPGVYYLNFKPEQSAQWNAAAKAYTRATGVPVTVVTAASGTYEDTLRSEMAKSDPPTLFQVNGPVSLRAWRSSCLDLRDTALYQNLKSDDFALFHNGQVLGVAYAIETYGIICNKTLLAKAGYRPEDIDSFQSLKTIAEDIQSRREELGIRGAFASSGMDPSSDWRFKTHLANLPIYWEYRMKGISDSASIEGTYLDGYKRIWDVYLQNSTCEPAVIGARTGEDAASEFALGEAVFYQNGTWAYQDVTAEGLTDDDLTMIPIYIGVPGEDDQGLCTGSENYWCINKNAAPENVEATKQFVQWLVTDPEGQRILTEDMGFVTPFSNFDSTPQNALQRAAAADLASGREPVGWAFTTIPSENWKNLLGAALLEYAQGTGTWDAVEKTFVDGWRAEAEAAV